MMYFRQSVIVLIVVFSMVACKNHKANVQVVKPSSAQPEVSIWKDQLEMPGLNRERQIRIYVPPDYANSGKRYPVLYMHDAQNLFDQATADKDEWCVDETMNALARSGKLELIVVGVDNYPAKRMTELNPWPNAEFGAPEGRAYMEFIVKIVKPLIDKQYRTKPDRANTAIMGASMGGLITHFAIIQYPDVFSKAGIFSPSYWAAKDSFRFFKTKPLAKDSRAYFLIGDAEPNTMLPDMKRMYALVSEQSLPETNTILKIVPGGGHSELMWGSEFEQAVLWMFSPDANQVAH